MTQPPSTKMTRTTFSNCFHIIRRRRLITAELQQVHLPVGRHFQVQAAHRQRVETLRVLKCSRSIFTSWWCGRRTQLLTTKSYTFSTTQQANPLSGAEPTVEPLCGWAPHLTGEPSRQSVPSPVPWREPTGPRGRSQTFPRRCRCCSTQRANRSAKRSFQRLNISFWDSASEFWDRGWTSGAQSWWFWSHCYLWQSLYVLLI